ncbi:MAG TPA: 3-dehydroquinate synthase, partial [Verrucomicrobiae bacterium]|nr:3-dehydroquinate synthase [Verrucomicrobiae bacterium]
RGVRLIRVPSTVLAQNDAGVGVKNGVNLFGSKNFAGTFTPPAAVFNDSSLLRTLHPRDARSGIAEAVKVAVIRDASFFDYLFSNRFLLRALEAGVTEEMIFRCADLHLRHIRGGDPFEISSARPLDFGHWAAHRMEELTGGELRHGEGVAVGIALDSLYAVQRGMLTAEEADSIILLLRDCGLPVSHPALRSLDVGRALEDFRRHLGGRTTITLPAGIGRSIDVHGIDVPVMRKCIMLLLEGNTRDCLGEFRRPTALIA